MTLAGTPACLRVGAMRVGGSLLWALVGGLLVAVGTAASLVASDVHGAMLVLAVGCASLATGVVAYANSVQKKCQQGIIRG